MTELLKIILACLTGADPEENRPTAVDEKHLARDSRLVRSDQDVADDIVHLLRTAEKNGTTLRRQLSDAIGEQGWIESIARAIVAALEKVVREGRDKMGPALAEAVDATEDAARDVFTFSKDHPYLVAGFVTIVAVGILVLMAPWVVEALGFSELGPVAGKWKPLPPNYESRSFNIFLVFGFGLGG
jgi:ElaB/YqjD/DUF883 family membrane-anchored ribosome-binding protein